MGRLHSLFMENKGYIFRSKSENSGKVVPFLVLGNSKNKRNKIKLVFESGSDKRTP